ncbi:ABC transporter ATP-binding protein [Sporosarcina sp. PTS2304]|uniref:ABC transporter ATP-binding protein n=1 Tax=Sporosarcina sp. PTS2304 TaxID=2283194 RepID=UPI000E0D916C|nr:ABC transporter ATP-binding protein [Sporosarcina sp. PTS2304]AXH98279.1 ABC transporter ATP-binding protein [Sporosarcina sp. PTS2304]
MIEIESLTYAYFRKNVLNDINLHIEKNERCALVGRNGAGKSTLIKLLLDLLTVKKGGISLHGIANHKQEWKKYVSYLPEKFQLYPHLSGMENMRFFASLSDQKPDISKMERILQSVSLYEARNDSISTYSKGMLQRLGLGLVLYYDTEIIILDEPTSGLDPIGREEILTIISNLQNKTILMASHHLSEIKRICTHVAFLEDGQLTKYTVDEFIETHMKEEWH